MKFKFNESNTFKITNKYVITNINSSNYVGIRLLNTYTKSKYYYEVMLRNISNYMLFGVCDEEQSLG
ncbi:hypothetical protein [Clostridium botulinum]|uniref:hypothetical protein n=1 Tax=Clostridium botulinum TaxID=1491 RepID=UPI0004D88065|nr:hypothetical protein [Clostridium botulinum]KEH99977.1 hypothetical protein Z952_14750 [Clostridium botulinum C/D str. BKT75002]KEI05699.1 hypothetical protein Z954_14930 [Clostridium botulinum C/D str. BKT2873]MCD3351773.1 hypothetical protein [Clostridium botulinum D/C]MCD3360699.1 hypothetical protein [Clostridium botulinum D/C]MCD3362125.1 hypothetical protein [Clostridium botulinum D/C]